MSLHSFSDGLYEEESGLYTSAPSFGVLLAGSSANVKGSLVQISDPVQDGCVGLVVNLFQGSNRSNGLIDLYYQPAGTALFYPIVLSLAYSMPLTIGGGQKTGYQYNLPIVIPEGATIYAQAQFDENSRNCYISLNLLYGAISSDLPYQQILTAGADEATSEGIAIDPGTTANTKGPWFEIASFIPFGGDAFMVAVQNGPQHRRTGNTVWLMDIAVGDPGEEVVVYENLQFVSGYASLQVFVVASDHSMMMINNSPVLPLRSRRGSRLSVRCQCNQTNAWRVLNTIFYGFAK